MSNDQNIVVATIDRFLNGLPLIGIICTKHFHTDWNMVHTQDNLNNFLTGFDEVSIGGTNEELILFLKSVHEC